MNAMNINELFKPCNCIHVNIYDIEDLTIKRVFNFKHVPLNVTCYNVNDVYTTVYTVRWQCSD